MNGQLLLLAAFVGWCGTPWPRPWPWPGPGPGPGPDPDPWMSKVIGVVGGLIGGWAVASMAGGDSLVATVVGAWVGSVFFNNVYGLARGGLRR